MRYRTFTELPDEEVTRSSVYCKVTMSLKDGLGIAIQLLDAHLQLTATTSLRQAQHARL